MTHPTHACVRRPGSELTQGLALEDRGAPDPGRAREQHAAYVAALETAGLRVHVLEADPAFPDGCFVEDTHLVLPELVVRLSPGAPSRAGEPEGVRPGLPADRSYARLPQGCRLDGGDVLRVGRHLWVGLSGRSEAGAARALGELLAPFGYTVATVAVPAGLHLKTGLTALADGQLVASAAFAAAPSIRALGELLVLPEGEDAGANLLPLQGSVVLAAGCPGLRQALQPRAPGCRLLEVDLGEFHKVDGMITCLSLVW